MGEHDYERELMATSERTGAPYAELLCLVRSLGSGRGVRVDAERRVFICTSADGARELPFGWLESA